MNIQSSHHKGSPLKYFLLVFGLSAPLWILQTQIKKSGLPLDIPITDIIAAFMPLTVACILVGSENGSQAVRDLLRRVFDFRRITRKRWYLVVCLLPLLLFAVIYATLHVTGVPLPDGWQVSLLSIPLLLVFFFFGAVGEEVGYMGYAFEPMQRRWGALGAALLIGVPWAVWHYPSILEQGHNFTWILWGTLGTVAIRVLLVWIYNNTNASLFACIMFHTLYNTGRVLFPHSANLNPLVDYPAIHYSVLAGTALVVALLWDSRTLTKFRPGIQH
jgi:membrane protease YdiL (CAAX protease family)